MRKPPAFMEYASDMLASGAFAALSLRERGLFYSLRLRCWVDGSIPDDAEMLALLVGAAKSDVVASLPAMRIFFTPCPLRSGRLICVELEKYRNELELKRQAQSRGGKLSSRRKQQARTVGGGLEGPAAIGSNPASSIGSTASSSNLLTNYGSTLEMNRDEMKGFEVNENGLTWEVAPPDESYKPHHHD